MYLKGTVTKSQWEQACRVSTDFQKTISLTFPRLSLTLHLHRRKVYTLQLHFLVNTKLTVKQTTTTLHVQHTMSDIMHRAHPVQEKNMIF